MSNVKCDAKHLTMETEYATMRRARPLAGPYAAAMWYVHRIRVKVYVHTRAHTLALALRRMSETGGDGSVSVCERCTGGVSI